MASSANINPGDDSGPYGPPSALLREVLLERAPIAFSVWDTQLRSVWMNDVAAAQAGGTCESLTGLPLVVAARSFDLSEAVPAMRGVLETGEPVIDRELRRTLPDGTERSFSVSIFRLEDDDGSPLGVCALGVDASSSTARRQMSLLSDAGIRIGTTLDVNTTAQELADVAVPAVADYVAVDLCEPGLSEATFPEGSGHGHHGPTAFRRAGSASIHPDFPEAAFAVGEVIFHPAASPVARPLFTGKSHLEPRLDTAEFWQQKDPVRASAVKRAKMQSAMFVPLKARGEILGVALFIRIDNPVPFTRDDLFVAEELSARAALSLDNARQYSRERAAALVLQRGLLPNELPNESGLDTFASYLPSGRHGVGGDWYDVIPLANGNIAMVVGDVVGHGVNAAASMGRLRTAVNTLADLCLPPHELLGRLDYVALRLSRSSAGTEALSIPTLTASCVYGVYNPVTRMFTVALAGHPPPLFVTPDGHREFADAPVGAPVGWGLSSYASLEVELPENSLIALFTDGLIESRSDDIDVGLGRLADAFGDNVTERLDLLGAHVIDTMTRGTAPQDDIALLLARTRAVDD